MLSQQASPVWWLVTGTGAQTTDPRAGHAARGWASSRVEQLHSGWPLPPPPEQPGPAKRDSSVPLMSASAGLTLRESSVPFMTWRRNALCCSTICRQGKARPGQPQRHRGGHTHGAHEPWTVPQSAGERKLMNSAKRAAAGPHAEHPCPTPACTCRREAPHPARAAAAHAPHPPRPGQLPSPPWPGRPPRAAPTPQRSHRAAAA